MPSPAQVAPTEMRNVAPNNSDLYNPAVPANLPAMQPFQMHKSFFPLALVAIVALTSFGCARSEQKFGRGVRNMTEFARMGEIRRSVEQTALFDSPDMAYTTGFIEGFNKSLARTGVGIYEVLTAPFPPYDPVFTDYIPEHPQYPDSHRPQMLADPTVGPDTYLGFSGGAIAPMVPGSRFRIFDF
jgi:putative exosortase-associated protein (TIGR04073 family)